MPPHASTKDPADCASLTMKALDAARAAQPVWAATPLATRLQIARAARLRLAQRAEAAAETSARIRRRPAVEMLTAEVLPLLEAHRFAERSAAAVLRPRRLSARGRPLWLGGVRTEIRREPIGLALIIAPANYPLFLTGVQTLQALVAGNAALVKPAPGTAPAVALLQSLWAEAGLDPRLFSVLPEDPASAQLAISEGVGKVFVTGRPETGRAVLRLCAETCTPATLELSGSDAVIVREDADLELVARALVFGLRLNGGATCIAPRRVFVHRSAAERLEAHVAEAFSKAAPWGLPAETDSALLHLVRQSLDAGASALFGGFEPAGALAAPTVLSGCRPESALLRSHIEAPLLTLVAYDRREELLRLLRQCPLALGASVFSRNERAAAAFAAEIPAGVVTINDLIFPTADPRIPFGGRAQSGFGVTRGAEGLLEMTVPKTITISSGKSRPHFAPAGERERRLFSAYIGASHAGGWGARFRAVRRLASALRAFGKGKPHDQPS